METTEGLELISVFKRVRRILYLEEKKVGFSYSGQVKKSLLKSYWHYDNHLKLHL